MNSKTDILSDEEIIANFTGNREIDKTIRFLYSSYFEYVGRFVVNNSGDWQDAEDIFQEVLVAFIHLVKKEKFRGESRIKTFLFSLNRNMWLNELKRRSRAEVRETKFEKEKEDSEVVTSIIENREATDQLMKVMDELGDTCKKILLLYYYENRSMKEILRELHYENEQVVRNKKHKCLKKLQEMLSQNKHLYNQLKNLLHE
jgi:RNA polymerase sigma factor (sigma-70 family)